MRSIQRKTTSNWNEILTEGTWISHLNDLRMLIRGTNETEWQLSLLNELKLLCLFHGERLILPDSDINNSPAFQELFIHNVHHIQTAFVLGRLVPAIRNNVDSLADLNAQQGDKRAQPSMFERTKIFAKQFDEFYRQKELFAVEWDLAAGASSFQDAIVPFYSDPLSPLPVSDRELLTQTCQDAVARHLEGKLLFGNIYNILVREKSLEPTHRVIQAARAAHVTNLACRLGFSPSVPVNDIDMSLVQFAVRGAFKPEPVFNDLRGIVQLLPRMIPTEADLNRLSFSEIPKLQAHGHEVGYFKSLAKVREAVNVNHENFEKEYICFLEALGAYLEKLKIHAKFELANWQEGIRRQHIDSINSNRELQKMLVWAVPVAILTATWLLMGINVAKYAGPTSFYLVKPGEQLIDRNADNKIRKLKYLLDGTATVIRSR